MLLTAAAFRVEGQAATGGIDIVVTASEGQVALENTRVSLEPLGRQGLTSDEGRLAFVDIPPGSYRLHAQRIGYIPAEVGVEVRAGERSAVTLRLTHVVVQLTGVRVIAFPPCRAPGVPDRAKDAMLASLLEQLRLNGEQYRYMVDSVPFSYLAERRSGTVSRTGEATVVSVDTIAVSSTRNGWRYRAGRVISTVTGALGRPELAMNLPVLDDFASREFLKNHCFYLGGVEREDSLTLLRIDFRAAERLRSPDVHGSIWLDSTTFTIRRANVELSRLPRELRGVDGVSARTTFVEWMKAVPIIDRVDGETVLQPIGVGVRLAANTESHRLLQVVQHEREPLRRKRE